MPFLGSHTIEVNNQPLFIKVNQVKNYLISNIANAISGHESRGAQSSTTTVNPITGAIGESQITPIMFNEWKRNYAKDKNTAQRINFNQLKSSPALQQKVTNESTQGILDSSTVGEYNWPVLSRKFKGYKEEIKKNFNHPVYWVAGEWVAGPNWVGKLDNKTSPGAKETVRDYITSVGKRFFKK